MSSVAVSKCYEAVMKVSRSSYESVPVFRNTYKFSVAVISLPEQLVNATKQLRKCSGAVTKVFRSSYESAP